MILCKMIRSKSFPTVEVDEIAIGLKRIFPLTLVNWDDDGIVQTRWNMFKISDIVKYPLQPQNHCGSTIDDMLS